jgi:hypothetical protein
MHVNVPSIEQMKPAGLSARKKEAYDDGFLLPQL